MKGQRRVRGQLYARRGWSELGITMRGGLTPEAIFLIPVCWKTAVDITHSSGGYISSCALAASCAMHRNKLGRARANPHWERDHHYRRHTHRGECGAVPSFALSKNRSCLRHQQRSGSGVPSAKGAFLGSRGGLSNRDLGRRGGTHPHSFKTRESGCFAYTQTRPCNNAMRSFSDDSSCAPRRVCSVAIQ